MTLSSKPTEAERDELVALDGDYTMEEAARILLSVKPEDLPEAADDDAQAAK
jgi:hypothetical protein